jgi:uncharacterized NAD(P)/FAD-binding protein YdhS
VSASKHTVAIIGGGFCGVMAAVQLLRISKNEPSILLFEAGNEVGRGVAYSSYTSGHLLNVPARNMSAFPDQSGDFVDWLRQQADYSNFSKEEIGQLFVPRILFGNYIQDLFNREISNRTTTVNIIAQRVIACRKSEDDYLLQTAEGQVFSADKVVIATGNFLPGKPKGIPHSFTGSNRYFKNPWDPSAVNVTDEKIPVLIAGTGLTMVDVVIGLMEKRPQQKIIAISPKGYEILSHKHYGNHPAILEELHPPYQLDQLVKIFRKHIQAVWKRGITGEAVVDAVRSKTQEIWSALTMEEKKRFLSHLRHLWGLARHRLPAGIHSLIRQLRERGQLNIIAGRIIDAHEDGSSVIVTYLERKTNTVKEIRVSRIINCTGPQTDVLRLNDPLFKQLYEDGMITPDLLGMGIRCDEYCRPIKKNGSISPNLFAMGSLLKGDRWESTAVPELRVQARQIAELLAK